MRTLLITEVFPPQTGGSGRWFWEIYRRLDRGATAILAGSQPGDLAFDQTHDLDVTRTTLSFPTWGVFSRTGFACYRQLFRRVEEHCHHHSPAQIHCGKALPEGFVAWWMKRKRGIPYLCYVHGEELNVAARSRELRWMTRRVLRAADRVIANSENTATLLRDEWSVPDTGLSVLHPGVDIDRFFPADRDHQVRQQLGWDDRPVVLTVSRLQRRKGHAQLIRALPAIRQAQPAVLYSIVGDGPERASLVRLASDLGVNDCVDFRGEVSDDEMVCCYQQCDVFALPNRNVDGDFEGFGMVLLEAQACGRPVIGGDSGGTGEAIKNGQTGFLVNCESGDFLADKIESLLSDRDQCESMGHSGRRWCETNFGWDSLLAKATDVFAVKSLAAIDRCHNP